MAGEPRGGCVSELRPFLVDESVRTLLGERSLAAIDALFPLLPAARAGGFECPLGHQRTGASFSVRLTARDGPLEALQQFDALRRLHSAIAHHSSLLARAVDDIWLELDAHDDPHEPNVFVRLKSPYGLGLTFGPTPNKLLEQTLSAIDALSDSLDMPADPTRKALLRRCVETMPASSSIAFVGVMLGRDSGLRLIVGHVPLIGLTAYLTTIGWAKGRAIQPLVPLVDALKPRLRHVGLHLDVGTDLGPKLGFELKPEPHENQATWAALLNVLRMLGVCTAQEEHAILAWPAQFHASTSADVWPRSANGRDSLARRINHVKLVYDAENGRPHAKAYLAYAYGTPTACFRSRP